MANSANKVRTALYSATPKQAMDSLFRAVKACEELIKESEAQPVHPMYTNGIAVKGYAARKVLAAIEKGLGDD
jgi:hypothetical protein